MRAVYLLTIAPAGDGVAPDSLFFRGVARALAEGDGFAHVTAEYTLEPTAAHPPGYPFALAALALLGIESDGAFRATSVGFGTLTVAGIGVLARRVAGELAGIVAALIAALYPTLIAADGALMSESLFGLCVVLAMLAAYRLRQRAGRPPCRPPRAE